MGTTKKYHAFLLLVSLFACSRQQPQQPAEIIDETKHFIKTCSITAGETLSGSLLDTPLSPESRMEVITHLAKVFSPRRCRAGDQYELTVDSTSQWISFKYFQPGLDYYVVEKSSQGAVSVSKKTKQARRVLLTASGSVQSSLWEAMTAQKIHPEIIVNFSDIFAWQFDFLTEPRKGDRFKLVWEQFVADDSTTVNGAILAAQYEASGTPLSAFLFTNKDGDKEYYDANGKILRNFFLKAPLQFRRISSFFTRRRYHPVLKIFRPHLGVDYAAPTGTPVSSIGAGVVTFVGRKGGYGKYISVRHANGYASYYGHLSRYAKGLRAGLRVQQGQVIGFVGSTGLSSGPHLDFRVTKEGKFINFLKLKFPPAGSIPAADQQEFDRLKADYTSQFAQIH